MSCLYLAVAKRVKADNRSSSEKNCDGQASFKEPNPGGQLQVIEFRRPDHVRTTQRDRRKQKDFEQCGKKQQKMHEFKTKEAVLAAL